MTAAVAHLGARGGSPARLGSNAITVTAQAQSISEALAPYRAARAALMRDAARWRKVDAAFAMGSAKEIAVAGRWHLQRADGLEISVCDRMLDCGGKCAQFMTPDGEIIEIATRCGQRLCKNCAASRGRKLGNRVKLGAAAIDGIELALRAAARSERKEAVKRHAAATQALEKAATPDEIKRHRKDARIAWAQAVTAGERMKHRKLELVTFTLRHGPNEDATRQAKILRSAWPLFRSSMQKRVKKAMTMAKFEEAAGTTRAHVHWHALMWMPPVCWSEVNRIWNVSVNSARRKMGLATMGAAGNVDISKKQNDSSKIAAYASKAYHYAAKQGLQCEAWDTLEAAEYLDFCYGRRLFTASPGLFPNVTTGCEFLGFRPWASDEAPPRPVLAPAHAPTGPPALYVCPTHTS